MRRSLFLKILLVLIILIISHQAPVKLNELILEGVSQVWAQESPQTPDQTGIEQDPQSPGAKAAEEKEEKKEIESSRRQTKEEKMRKLTGGVELKTWHVALLIAIPIIIVAIIFVVLFFRGRTYEDEGDVETKADAREGKKRIKGSRRLQLALELLDTQKIAREGSLDTDYHFVCIEGANKGEKFEIKKHVSTIGRRSTNGRINDIEISSLEKKVSRSQAKLVYKPDDDKFYLVNESDVPIRVNGQRVRQAFPLEEEDVVELAGGEVKLRFRRKVYEIEEKI